MKLRLGIDQGGTSVKYGVVDEHNSVVVKHSVPTRSDQPFEHVMEDIARGARETAAKVSLRLEDFASIGVGTTSCINPDTGLLVFSNNTNWRNVPLGQELERRMGVAVRVENDANCAIIGEAVAGAAQGYSDVLMLTLGTGVGGSLLLGGQLFSGADGMGTELGHITFVYGGVPCTCGVRGCFEAYASVTALIGQTRAAMEAHPDSLLHKYAAKRNGRVSGRTAFEAVRENDAAAQEVVDTFISYVGAGIGGFVNTFRPQIVLIGGGLSNEGDALLAPLNAKAEAYTYASDIIGAPRVVAAALGNDAGFIGAACLEDFLQK